MKCVRPYKSLKELPEIYAKLFQSQKNKDDIFSNFYWFENLFGTVFRDAELILMGVERVDGTRAFALLPLVVQDAPSKLKIASLHAAANYYTSHFAPIESADELEQKENAYLLVRAITENYRQFSYIDLRPMDIASSQFTELIQELSSTDWPVQKFFCFGNWYLDVKGRTFSEYFQALPSQLQNTIKRKGKQLTKNKALRIEIIQDSLGVSDAISAYQNVYEQSWKQKEPHPAFIEGLIRGAAEKKWLRLGIAYLNEEPVAAQIWLVYSSVAYIYKLAYVEAYSSSSVGTVLTANLMEYVIDVDKVNQVDYLTGDDEYKKDWMSHRREMWGLRAYNLRSLGGLCGYIHFRLGQVFRKFWR